MTVQRFFVLVFQNGITFQLPSVPVLVELGQLAFRMSNTVAGNEKWSRLVQPAAGSMPCPLADIDFGCRLNFFSFLHTENFWFGSESLCFRPVNAAGCVCQGKH